MEGECKRFGDAVACGVVSGSGLGVLGLLVILLLVLGATVTAAGVIKRAWWLALIGTAMLGAAYVFNYAGPMA